MLSNVRILLVMAAYFTLTTIAYGVWTYIDGGAIEPIGTAAMGLLIILSVFVAYYLWMGTRRTATLPHLLLLFVQQLLWHFFACIR